MNKQMEGNDLVTSTEAAALKGVTRQAVYAAIRDGRLPSRQFGPNRVHLIKRSDVDAWHVIKHGPKPRLTRGQEGGER